MPAYLIGALAFMVGIVIFILQNNTPVTIQFINWHTAEISLALVALIAALGGAVITFLIDSFRAFKTGRKLNELTNNNKKLEREITSLKAKNASSTENKKPTT
ncbi:MAG TPA: LapA family protein [Syntrophomonas sp.]|nr:LapA family protein [Syntrophomonas sp.]HPT68511.1 LapA family protein [Syntrophomonas sp.]